MLCLEPQQDEENWETGSSGKSKWTWKLWTQWLQGLWAPHSLLELLIKLGHSYLQDLLEDQACSILTKGLETSKVRFYLNLSFFNKKVFKAYMYLWKVLVLDTQYFLPVKSENSPTGCSDNAALLLWQCRLLGIQEMSIPVITTRDYGTHWMLRQ